MKVINKSEIKDEKWCVGDGVWSVDRNKSEDKTNEDAIN